MPAWWSPWKGTAAPVSAAGTASLPPPFTTATVPPAAAAPSASPAPPQPSSARREGDLPGPVASVVSLMTNLLLAPASYFATAAASLDSGSASALTVSESCLRSLSPTLSYAVKS